MGRKALFAGLVVDEYDQPTEVVYVGGEALYVVNDDGFRRHIQSEYVDRQVLNHLRDLMSGHEDLITEGTMKMIGQEDIFTKAMIETSLKNVEAQFDALIEQGLPEEAQAWLGMLGFKVMIDLHGDVIEVIQPSESGESNE